MTPTTLRPTAVPAENLSESAQIMIVGEAPGENEELEGSPFVGASGRYLNRLLMFTGLYRHDCCITNVVDVRPPENDFGVFYLDRLRKKPTDELRLHRERLAREVAYVEPNILVACGREALYALTGQFAIKKYRGSLLPSIPPYMRQDGTPYKVIGMFHPAYLFRQWAMRTTSVIDLQRVKEQAETPLIPEEKRELIVIRTLDAFNKMLADIVLGDYLSFDIETAMRSTITHMGLCSTLNTAYSIVFCEPPNYNVFTEEEELYIWTALKHLFEGRMPKIAQNAQYDCVFLKRVMGIDVHCLHFDTMVGHHVLYPELPKDLGFLCSFYIDIPYYKDELHSDIPEQRALYNAKDACVTYEIAVTLLEQLKMEGLLEFYYHHAHNLLAPLMEMQLRGVLVDEEIRQALRTKYKALEADSLSKVQALAGTEINLLSPKQLGEFLYGTLGLAPIYKRGSKKGRITTDEEAILKLYEKTGQEALKSILDYRHARKMVSTYIEAPLRNSRCHTSYNVAASTKPKRSGFGYEIRKSAPVTGRLSSSSDIFGYGTNLQNQPDEVRSMYIPDDGRILCAVDLSQAEAMVTAYLANEVKMIAMFQEGKKIHQYVASLVFEKPYATVGKGTPEYDLGKRLVHGTNYGMEEKTFAHYASITPQEARTLLNKYKHQFPGIRRYHEQIATEVRYKDPPTFTTPVGRRRQFLGHKNPKMVKEALAFIPQSTIADVLNLSGLVKLPFIFAKRGVEAELLMQVHDEIIFQHDPACKPQVLTCLQDAFHTPLIINNQECIIPYEVQFGYRWSELESSTTTDNGAQV